MTTTWVLFHFFYDIHIVITIMCFSSSDKESLSDSAGGGQGQKGTPTSAEKPTSKQVHVSFLYILLT